MANKIIGKDVIFRRENTPAGGVYTDLAQVISIKWAGHKRDAIDVSNVDSTANYREFIGGMRDGGEVSVGVIYDEANATHAQITTDLESDVITNYRIALPAPISKVWTLPGLVTSIGREIPFEGKVTLEFTIKISGQPSVT
jgi:predicted secreted protein